MKSGKKKFNDRIVNYVNYKDQNMKILQKLTVN